MKTQELIENVNDNTSIIAKLEYGKISFYCHDNDFYFYSCPVDATALESGKSYIQCIANVSMEDIFAEDDWEAYNKYSKKLGDSVQIVGDDL